MDPSWLRSKFQDTPSKPPKSKTQRETEGYYGYGSPPAAFLSPLDLPKYFQNQNLRERQREYVRERLRVFLGYVFSKSLKKKNPFILLRN